MVAGQGGAFQLEIFQMIFVASMAAWLAWAALARQCWCGNLPARQQAWVHLVDLGAG